MVAAEDLEAGPSSEEEAAEQVVSFRALREEDLPELKELQRSLFPVQYSDSFYNRLLTDGHYTMLGVTSTGGLLGTGEIVAVGSVRTVHPDNEPDTDVREAYIMTLGVKETFRRRNLGTLVMRECLNLIRDHSPCDMVEQPAVLHVKSDNIAALAFYQKFGFSIDANGFCKDHYLIDGVLYHAFRLTYMLPQPSSSYLSFLRCTVI